MVYIGYFRYILQHIPTLFLKNISLNAIVTMTVIVPSYSLYYIFCTLRYSYFFKNFSLLDLGGYDIPIFSSILHQKANTGSFVPILWYILKDILGNQIFFFSINNVYKNFFRSIELLFRNARWLEREASEFFGFFFEFKSDRRVLFTIPLFYNSPFRRKYPTIGFYEIFFCPILKKLKFKHLSLQI